MSDSSPDSSDREAQRARRSARHRARRVRFAPAAVVGALAASAVIALSMSGTLAGFVAQITNDNNQASSGYLVMQETDGTTTCNSNGATPTSATTASNSISCNINKFNGSTTIVPGGSVTANVTIKNTGTVTANTFTLTPGTCAQTLGPVNGGATDACSKFTLAIASGATPVKAATPLSTLASTPITLPSLAAGASASYTFTLTLPAQANSTADNAYQGIQVKQDLVWNFTS